MSTPRRYAALVTLAFAAPAVAYVPPATTVLRDTVKRLAEAQPATVEARGTLRLGDAPPVPATLWVKAGRCRLELSPPGASPAERPAVVVRSGKVASTRAMGSNQSAVAMTEAACALLAAPRDAGADRALAQALAQRGVAATTVSLGHLGTRIAWVLGGVRGAQPQAWIGKEDLLPLRLVADLAGARRDVRLLEWSGAPGASFPHVVEVHAVEPPPDVALADEGGRDTLEARFAVERVVANPRIPDSMF